MAIGDKIIPEAELPKVLNELYNSWFLKWRDKASTMTDSDWDDMVDAVDPIWKLGEQYPIVNHLVITFLYELDARMHGGYTETTKNKLIKLIGG